MGVEFYEDGHLGGYIIGGDPATQYPELWIWLVSKLGIKSVLDVGCGEGQAVKFFGDLGADAIGIDGVAQDDPRIIQHDFTKGPCPDISDIDREFDLVWSCEFVEHVEPQYLTNFLELFAMAPMVLMTHAEPGQGGYHHVNCRFHDYWEGVLEGQGYKLDLELTRDTRTLASYNQNAYNHYARSGLAFVRRDAGG